MDPSSAPGAGVVLRNARRRRGVDIAQAARASGLDDRTLVRLENEPPSDWAGDARMLAAVRMYARSLHLDPEPLVGSAGASATGPPQGQRQAVEPLIAAAPYRYARRRPRTGTVVGMATSLVLLAGAVAVLFLLPGGSGSLQPGASDGARSEDVSPVPAPGQQPSPQATSGQEGGQASQGGRETPPVRPSVQIDSGQDEPPVPGLPSGSPAAGQLPASEQVGRVQGAEAAEDGTGAPAVDPSAPTLPGPAPSNPGRGGGSAPSGGSNGSGSAGDAGGSGSGNSGGGTDGGTDNGGSPGSPADPGRPVAPELPVAPEPPVATEPPAQPELPAQPEPPVATEPPVGIEPPAETEPPADIPAPDDVGSPGDAPEES